MIQNLHALNLNFLRNRLNRTFYKFIKIDGFVKSHEFNYRWLSKKVHIQGVVVFQGRRHTYKYVEGLKKYYNAVDGIFYDAIKIDLTEKIDLFNKI